MAIHDKCTRKQNMLDHPITKVYLSNSTWKFKYKGIKKKLPIIFFIRKIFNLDHFVSIKIVVYTVLWFYNPHSVPLFLIVQLHVIILQSNFMLLTLNKGEVTNQLWIPNTVRPLIYIEPFSRLQIVYTIQWYISPW